MLISEYVPGRLKFAGPIEYADMEMRFRRQWPAQAFAGQCRPAPGTKSPPGSSWRRIKLGNLSFGNRIGRVLESDKDRSRCAAMLAATFTMAPIYSRRLTSRNETDRAAQAAAFELVGRAAHNLILPLIRPNWAPRCSYEAL
jgi:hypothetical protein